MTEEEAVEVAELIAEEWVDASKRGIRCEPHVLMMKAPNVDIDAFQLGGLGQEKAFRVIRGMRRAAAAADMWVVMINEGMAGKATLSPSGQVIPLATPSKRFMITLWGPNNEVVSFSGPIDQSGRIGKVERENGPPSVFLGLDIGATPGDPGVGGEA